MLKWMIILCVVFSGALSAQVKVLAFAGSTRADSLNKKLVAEAANVARQIGADVTVVDLKDYPGPFYDGDAEAKEGMPVKLKEFRQLMIQSDVILIASPEYNGSLSGVLKNTIDWATRDEESKGSREAFKGKKFVIMSASPGSGGGARGLVHLRNIIEQIGGTVLPQEVTVPDAANAFDEQGRLKNEKTRKQLEEVIRASLQAG